jgi:hypothetical protein
MLWTTITDADLNATKMAPLVSALRTAALSEGQADPVDAIKLMCIDRVQRKIAACRTNQVDADTTKIPPSLKALPLALSPAMRPLASRRTSCGASFSA